MTGRILVVDAVPTNRIILRVKLSAAFYEVVQAASGHAAIAMMRKTRPDLVITSSELPDMTGRALCKALKRDQAHARTPIVIVHGEEDADERLASLSTGADDVLVRPIDDLVMLARLRSLLRARDAEAELQLRDDTRRALGLGEEAAQFSNPALVRLIPTGNLPDAQVLAMGLRERLDDQIEVVDADDALRERGTAPDVIVIAEGPDSRGEGLVLLPQLRASTHTRHSALIYIAQPDQRREAASALDMGANDLLGSGPDLTELTIRLRKQIDRKRTNDRLRANMQDGLRAAVSDPLTGLYNRRYALPHISRLADRAAEQRRPYALLVSDLDHFKQVNDLYGHAAGDAVLVTLSERLKDNLRAPDLISRWGGEEFLVAMPDTDLPAARATAERLCKVMAEQPVILPDGTQLTVTLSIGVAIGRPGDLTQPLALIEQADKALYAAKNKGRNTVVIADRIAALPGLNERPRPPIQTHTGDDTPRATRTGG
ncbi:diguanylate cyclase [Tropicibacter naphthalenivorans]|uniref:diguanylate cyclase n=1 Tax=Tropicibacter naphthalenivorans TaxID=441103 RepID=A0A0P1GJX2_9RHOB|nr:diguanylate cyclase [Tropicibacter naphthalenivorans]CUH82453.1 Stalked cell differentiation-controlling protein [Tropicibacter naphthalenivorans]SMD06037.1 response regulator receiver modulated diguanylate cyclase [Tropicibacter naphthalenivorans]